MDNIIELIELIALENILTIDTNERELGVQAFMTSFSRTLPIRKI